MQLVVDLGAHYLEGITTLLKEKVIKPDAHILSVEANPKTFQFVLNRKITEKFEKENAKLSSFNYMNLAVSGKNGFVEINSCIVDNDKFTRYRNGFKKSYELLKFKVKNLIKSILKIESNTYVASNILEKPPQNDGDRSFSYKSSLVPTLTLAEITNYALEKISSEDKIVDLLIKMDIEGAEFEALEKFIDIFPKSPLVNKLKSTTFYIEWHERMFDDYKFYCERRANISKRIKSYFGQNSLFDWD